jgi:GMP synthase-like glutamine amidotransferase
MTRQRLAFLQHGALDLPGVLGSLTEERGLAVHCVRADRVEDGLPDPQDCAGIVVMGSIQSVNDDQLEWVARERTVVRSAIRHDVPVFGICFGAQLLAQALGGRVVRSPEPEVGWSTIRSDDPSVVPVGPWLLWHEESVALPPGAVALARTDVALQAYRKGPHAGVQFHPEVTADLVGAWIDDARGREEVTAQQHRDLWAHIDEWARASALNARILFDGFLHRAGLVRSPDRSATARP